MGAGVPMEVRTPLCIGTSLTIIIPTSIRSYRANYARGAVDMEVLKKWWLPVLIGVIAGSVTARYAPERLFKIVFVAGGRWGPGPAPAGGPPPELGGPPPPGDVVKKLWSFSRLFFPLFWRLGGLFS